MGNNKKIVVLGGGPGGYAAAFLAADKGMNVTLIDTGNKPGGVCLHRGCIPSKALLHIAHLINETKEAKTWGIDFGEPKIDLDGVRNWKNKVIDKMATGLTQLCKQRKVEFVSAKGNFKDSNTIEANGKLYSFDHCILSTGSRPAQPFKNISPLIDSTDALELKSIPKDLLVVGGGYIVLELGCVYAELGILVTIFVMTKDILPGVDRDLVRPLHHRIKNQFEAILVNTKVKDFESKGSKVSVTFENESGIEQKEFDQALVSIGRRPNTENIGLDNTKVKLNDKGFVIANSQQKTEDPSILAIGDVIGGPMLAHKAAHEAKVAVEVLNGEKSDFNNRVIPAVVFTDPEIAWAGLTENEAHAQGRNVKVVKFPWGASGRAQTLGRGEGLTKLLIDPESERIIGVGLTGPGAGELIAEGVLAIQTQIKAKELALSIHPHPTLSETMMETAEVFYGTATHIYKKRGVNILKPNSE
jgi:dihydrolipoamide dehydrogenase